ncbi:hypothetical protein [Streptomyces sp. AC512_CC834]|uniref:hypothetical protein n=1 Tax=Streptomyces sp. AC512_CC834 TaxID=2823691 RepID=UPI001C27875F|nr:hypothetical protein [Streptomyces sp. AC512_CC834]
MGSVYIRTSAAGGVVSRIADSIEERQVDGARVFLDVVGRILEADRATVDEAMALLGITMEHLRDVIGVADARGSRLHETDPEEDDEDDEDEDVE